VADDERAYLKQIEKLTRVRPTIVPLPENFLAEVARLPKPKLEARPDRPAQAPRRHDGQQRPGGGPSGQRRRRQAGVGTHKGAVRKTTGGGR
jgi:ATP-dependent RNA helicase RhlE